MSDPTISSSTAKAEVNLSGYQAARQTAALHDQSARARLWVAGPDRIAFLQRLTTNEMRLQPGQGTVTVLTSPTARILAVFTVLAYPDGLLLLAGPGEGPKAYTTLRSQVFFADQVTVDGRGDSLCQYGLYGPQAEAVLAAAGVDGLEQLSLFAWQARPLAGADVAVQRNEGLGHAGFTLLAPALAGDTVRESLLAAGASAISEKAYQVLRVEAGVPAPGAELTDQVNPLEAGLRRFCDDHKGCYTGQEIIARQVTYDKVTTHLVGLLPEAPVNAGDLIHAEDRRVGFVSSAVHSLALDRPIALGFVRRPYHEPGTWVSVAVEHASVTAQVSALPFTAGP